MHTLPHVDDFIVPLGATPDRPALPASATRFVGAMALVMIGLLVAGGYVGYRLLKGRIPFGGLVGALGGAYVLPKVAGPIVGLLLEPMARRAARDMGVDCPTCPGGSR